MSIQTTLERYFVNPSLRALLTRGEGLIVLTTLASFAIVSIQFSHFDLRNRTQSRFDLLRTKFVRLRSHLCRQIPQRSGTVEEYWPESWENLKANYELDFIAVGAIPIESEELLYVQGGLECDDRNLVIGSKKPKLSFTPFIMTIPVLAVTIGLIVFFEVYILNRKILLPALTLVESIRERNPDLDTSRWPAEFQDLFKKLTTLLWERDQAIKKALIQENTAIKESEYSSFAHSLLHSIKRPLLVCMRTLKQSSEISEETKRELIEILDRPHAWIQKGLTRYIENEDASGRWTNSTERWTHISTLGATLQTHIAETYDLTSRTGAKYHLSAPTALVSKFCPISSHDLATILQNVINNALDALEPVPDKDLIVKWCLHGSEGEELCEITVKDSGIPFPSETLWAIRQGRTHTSKNKGSGYGLLDTKKILEQVGGKLSIRPFDGYKIVQLTVPVVAAPSWIADLWKIENPVVILDDDPLVNWQVTNSLRLISNQAITYFNNEDAFLRHAADHPKSTLLIDYDFKGRRSGLDLIVQERFNARAILLSGFIPFDRGIMQAACSQGVQMYPKESLARTDTSPWKNSGIIAFSHGPP